MTLLSTVNEEGRTLLQFIWNHQSLEFEWGDVVAVIFSVEEIECLLLPSRSGSRDWRVTVLLFLRHDFGFPRCRFELWLQDTLERIARRERLWSSMDQCRIKRGILVDIVTMGECNIAGWMILIELMRWWGRQGHPNDRGSRSGNNGARDTVFGMLAVLWLANHESGYWSSGVVGNILIPTLWLILGGTSRMSGFSFTVLSAL